MCRMKNRRFRLSTPPHTYRRHVPRCLVDAQSRRTYRRTTDDEATALRRGTARIGACLVERFAELHRRGRGTIWEFLDTSNAAGKPFVWTKSADEILASIARFAQRTLVVHN